MLFAKGSQLQSLLAKTDGEKYLVIEEELLPYSKRGRVNIFQWDAIGQIVRLLEYTSRIFRIREASRSDVFSYNINMCH